MLTGFPGPGPLTDFPPASFFNGFAALKSGQTTNHPSAFGFLGDEVSILWMDEILHHLETMGHHCWLVYTGESSFQGFLGGAGFRPSTVSRWLQNVWDFEFLLHEPLGTPSTLSPLFFCAFLFDGGGRVRNLVLWPNPALSRGPFKGKQR